MTEISTAEEIIKEITERYNKRPIGWLMASDPKGNAVIAGPDVGYRLKFMMISPTESIGYGARFDSNEVSALIDTGFQFGFRPVPSTIMKKILTDMPDVEKATLIRQILADAPVPLETEHFQGAGVLGGPLLHHPDLRLISARQRELDAKISLEVEREFRRKYPLRASIYR
ncbi:MAG: hypothetical protein QFX35_07005 [Candidatus Verstraetearchaeota archaeon]|nr:hypothetical protein [Candidatus Verstraetearchaeota archaeon]